MTSNYVVIVTIAKWRTAQSRKWSPDQKRIPKLDRIRRPDGVTINTEWKRLKFGVDLNFIYFISFFLRNSRYI